MATIQLTAEETDKLVRGRHENFVEIAEYEGPRRRWYTEMTTVVQDLTTEKLLSYSWRRARQDPDHRDFTGACFLTEVEPYTATVTRYRPVA